MWRKNIIGLKKVKIFGKINIGGNISENQTNSVIRYNDLPVFGAKGGDGSVTITYIKDIQT